MQTFDRIQDFTSHVLAQKSDNKSIGFVPTMGALHNGHISLIERSKKENEITVVSIFVNPTQFDNKEDLDKYPVTLKTDKIMLENAGCDVLLVPTVGDMYNKEELSSIWKQVNFRKLDKVMEGLYRPGHFSGVAQVVSKLFDIVQPKNAYFGQKDFQQLVIIKEMVKQIKYEIEIVACPTVRERDGLAMSSRNTRLNSEERKVAPKISQILFKAKEISRTEPSVKKIKSFAEGEFKKERLFELEYFEIADAATLQPIEFIYENIDTVVCVAVKLGAVRLIDNVLL